MISSIINGNSLLVLAMFLPFITAAVVSITGNNRIIRDVLMLVLSSITCALVIVLAHKYLENNSAEASFFHILPNIKLMFKVEPLGIIYAGLASGLWIVTILYSSSYFNYLKDRYQTRFFIFLSISIGASVSLAFAGNLLTMLIFYELLTLATYPLVAHKGDAKAVTGATKYLFYLIGTSLFLFVPAIIATISFAGTGDFYEGGAFRTQISDATKVVLLMVFAYGIGKAALMPLHGWLPAAMVAPSPVSALLHAVAVVKAGVFCLLKIIVYIFGIETLNNFGKQAFSPEILSYLAAISALSASMLAIFEDSLKRRLAYSTVAQLSYIILAATIYSSEGVEAASLHMLSHGFGKITLFFAAGAVIIISGKQMVSELAGIGRQMPLVMVCFLIASLSLIGLPGLAGADSKNLMEAAAMRAGKEWIGYVLYVAAALNALYLLPICWVAFFRKPLKYKALETPPLICAALIITTLLVIGFGWFDNWVLKLTARI